MLTNMLVIKGVSSGKRTENTKDCFFRSWLFTNGNLRWLKINRIGSMRDI